MHAAAKRMLLAEMRSRRAAARLHGVHVPKRAPKRLPRMRHPQRIAESYYAAIRRGPLAELFALVKARLVPILPELVARAAAAVTKHHDAKDADLSDTMDEIADVYADAWTSERIGAVASPFADRISADQRQQFGEVQKAALGVNITKHEPWLAAKIAQFTSDNVALIRSVSTDYLSRVESKVAQGLSDGLRANELVSDIIDPAEGVADSRAALIANDQAGKFFANINEARQADLGISRYTWRTVEDNRVREEHAERDGEVYSWDDPPSDDDFGPVNPGEAINCRCYAEPVLEDVYADLGVDD